jgi:hypothetical protein
VGARWSSHIAAIVAAVLTAAWLAAPPAARSLTPPAVSVFPSPGTQYNMPGTQITFRGLAASAIGTVTVVGSATGAHTGTILADSDGQGGSFMPAKPFAAAETVTVTTSLNILGGTAGKFSFKIAHGLGLISFGRLPFVATGPDAVQHFQSRPDLLPAAYTVTNNSAPNTEGDIFMAPQFGPVQNGPMILDAQGNLVWFDPIPTSTNQLATDFRVQTLFGQPVLTWWQGNTNAGHGRGVGVILNQNYQQIATVHGGNGLDMGLHEFLVTPQGDAYINCSWLVRLPGFKKPTVDSVVQEIDIRTGLVLFEWHALDHIPLTDSDFTQQTPGLLYDPYHVNSIALDGDGNPIISARNTSAVYKVDHQTGALIWRLGGKRSSFRMGPGTATAFQHDVVVQPDGTLTIFNDGAGPPTILQYAQGIRVALNLKGMTATLIRQYPHSPQLTTNFEGDAQTLPDGNVFMGWGQQPYFSEDTQSGQQIFDAHFNVPTSSYRAYRFPWRGLPLTPAALAVVPRADGGIGLYSSWNGSSEVASWRILGGPTPNALGAVVGGRRQGFESSFTAYDAPPYFEVQAIGYSGQVLGTSPVAATPRHIALSGHSAFAPPWGTVGLPASCYGPSACRITTTVSAGSTVIGRGRPQTIGPNGAGLLYFQLTGQGRQMLTHVPSRRLGVQVSARDTAGATATLGITLVLYSTSGKGPTRTFSQAPTLEMIGSNDYVSTKGTGGILAACTSSSPCVTTTTVSVGTMVIATTKPEYLGANQVGYLTFSLTPQGRRMLANAPGNQLGVHVTMAADTDSANADLALVQFH